MLNEPAVADYVGRQYGDQPVFKTIRSHGHPSEQASRIRRQVRREVYATGNLKSMQPSPGMCLLGTS
jgi:hypothetical protein